MIRARVVHHSEYLALALLLIGAAVWQKDQITWHNFTLPAVLFVALLMLFAGNPWPLVGWLLHIALDRTLGLGLRGPDGGQGLL